MKTFWSLSTKVLLILLLVSLWYIYQQNTQYDELLADYEKLESQLVEAQENISQLEHENKALEKKSVDGILRETNKIVVSGWETLLNRVEEELDKAKELIEPEKRLPQSEPEPAEEAQEEAETVIIDGERT